MSLLGYSDIAVAYPLEQVFRRIQVSRSSLDRSVLMALGTLLGLQSLLMRLVVSAALVVTATTVQLQRHACCFAELFCLRQTARRLSLTLGYGRYELESQLPKGGYIGDSMRFLL